MALITYLIAPCSGGTSSNIDFSGSSLPVVGGNYYLTSTGGTIVGCYEIVDSAEPATGTDAVLSLGTNYGDCLTCLAANPTPTPTITPTVTPTPTLTITPSVTKTQTPSVTPTKTPNVTVTPTKTVTPSVTHTKTPTPSVTKTSTPSLTQTATPSATITQTPTLTKTPTNTATPAVTLTQTPTNTPTLTKTPTNTPTLTKTPTQTPTPTQGTITIGLVGQYSRGSIQIVYVGSSSGPVPNEIQIFFTNTLGVISGSPIVVHGVVTILLGQTTGYANYYLGDNYDNLDGTSTFSSINILPSTPGVTFSVVTNGIFNVTPTPTQTHTPTPTPSLTSQFIIQVGPGYEECNVCYTVTGNTATSVSVPHAVWTNNQGIAVEQMNSVQLGGMNGLNN